ncbi:platelet-activating factor acetylhydrolase, isoform II-domain-containing protein [Schizothecium vesticola]|uniref:Putative phospholipase n=1 Tax=Schizothecium vesticola TaxID=314040 RepID=A0AA40F7I2_9PEZI|nr:platelet-activating factor acetylhydrolase, isoform II-domain-containing protein [Schizothecium vesticola]
MGVVRPSLLHRISSVPRTMATPSAGDSPSLLSRLAPVPRFPAYPGPHKVGTVDVEIPVDQLPSPPETPKEAAGIPTIQFRIFYPAVPDSAGHPITWLPAPQRLHLAAYSQFLGAGPKLASLLSYLPRNLHYITIPVHKNATVLKPNTVPSQTRWPTVLFSHGLGGTRNAYSYIAGSLASHGVVVVCPEHRDGSAAISVVRDPKPPAPRSSWLSSRPAPHTIPYLGIGHNFDSASWEARNTQLRIRLWELALTHEALLAIDTSPSLATHNLNTSTPPRALSQLTNLLDIHSPGHLIFAGHSFGAACMYDGPSAPGGAAILAVESDAFFKWKQHLHMKARIFSPDPTQPVVTAAAFKRADGSEVPRPNFFYVKRAAHLNQSDFGVLWPWLTNKVFGVEKPERCLRLNGRAMLQFLRGNGVAVARTGEGGLVDGGVGAKGEEGILEERRGVEAWERVEVVGLGGESGPTEEELGVEGRGVLEEKDALEGERRMGEEMEPALESPMEGGEGKTKAEGEGVVVKGQE